MKPVTQVFGFDGSSNSWFRIAVACRLSKFRRLYPLMKVESNAKTFPLIVTFGTSTSTTWSTILDSLKGPTLLLNLDKTAMQTGWVIRFYATRFSWPVGLSTFGVQAFCRLEYASTVSQDALWVFQVVFFEVFPGSQPGETARLGFFGQKINPLCKIGFLEPRISSLLTPIRGTRLTLRI